MKGEEKLPFNVSYSPTESKEDCGVGREKRGSMLFSYMADEIQGDI